IDDKYTIIILSNYDYGAESIYSRIEAIVFGKEYTLPGITADAFLYSLIKKDGFDSVEKDFSKILDNNNYKISGPGSLNTVGYKLIEEGDIQMAINFFRLNVKLFPDDANAYDSLGEAYMISGKKESAIENYKKSLEMDPSNTNAIKKIKLLEETSK
ncbi:MAG: tetratricopeptide repeat protein, partial [bacterium]